MFSPEPYRDEDELEILYDQEVTCECPRIREFGSLEEHVIHDPDCPLRND
jgi:hypothetical protein